MGISFLRATLRFSVKAVLHVCTAVLMVTLVTKHGLFLNMAVCTAGMQWTMEESCVLVAGMFLLILSGRSSATTWEEIQSRENSSNLLLGGRLTEMEVIRVHSLPSQEGIGRTMVDLPTQASGDTGGAHHNISVAS